MQLLIDTNILIHLEDNKVITEEFAAFYKLANANNYKIYYHFDCLKDLKRDKDNLRQQITLSKLKKYTSMPNPGVLNEEFKALVGQKNENDEVDNVQLFQVHKGYVDYFITEDKGIKTKAEKINLSSKVLTISEILRLLKEKYTKTSLIIA